MPNLEDALNRFRGGDGAAFRELVDATAPELVRLAARLLGSVADGEDAVQEAYTRAHRALTRDGFDARASVRTWLYRIVVHAAIDLMRARRRRQRIEREAVVEAGSATADAGVALRELDAWLAVLPTEQRVALTLKAIEGLTSSEIATIMGCSEGAVEQRLVRARATLRESRSDRE